MSHCMIAAKAYRSLGALLHSFRFRVGCFFTAYVLPSCAELRFSIIEALSQTGRQSTRKSSAAIYQTNMGHAGTAIYAERLSCLSALSLERSRDLADLYYMPTKSFMAW